MTYLQTLGIVFLVFFTVFVTGLCISAARQEEALWFLGSAIVAIWGWTTIFWILK